MAIGIISEHTSEFLLVSKLKAILEKKFNSVSPIYPWYSREFGRRSKEVNSCFEFYVLAMFPRRPKVDFENQVLMKINDDLVRFKEIAFNYGISVIAGMPIVKNLYELSRCNEVIWVDIDKALSDVTHYVEYFFDYSLNEDDITNLIIRGRRHSLESLETFIRESNQYMEVGFWGARYKPVYFLVFDELSSNI